MIFKAESIQRVKAELVIRFRQAADALEGLSTEGVQAIETRDGNVIVGEIVGIKYEDTMVLIRVIAAKEVDYKLRNLESKGVKKRT
jgi:hypothetical protein